MRRVMAWSGVALVCLGAAACEDSLAVMDGLWGFDAGVKATGSSSSGGAAGCTQQGEGIPQFAGATAATSSPDGGVGVTWSEATDSTPAADMHYLLWAAAAAGAEDFAGAPTLEVTGATEATLTGLTPGSTVFVVVRARDADGNVDCNTVEVSVVVGGGPAGCLEYATRVQTIFNGHCIKCHSGGGAPRGLHLDTHEGVMAGGATGSTVVACQPDSSLLFKKVSMAVPPVGVRMPADGPPYLADADIQTLRTWILEGARAACAEDNPCIDEVLPNFGGLTSADLADDTTALLCWDEGSDDKTVTDALTYDVYEAGTVNGEDFASPPRLTSPAGATCVARTGLTPGQQYCWIVRARDGAGNTDVNTVEKCLTTPAATCVDFATMVQPIFNQECIHCHSGATAPQGLHLDSYNGVLTGGATGSTIVGCQSGQSLLYKKISMAMPPVGIRMPADGPPYLTDAQIGTLKQWIDEGARLSCADMDPCSDAVPPTFAGLVVAGMVDDTSAALCWDRATDDLTASSALVYDVFEANVAGAQDYSAPPRVVSLPGETCVTRSGMTPGQEYCFVVRARDGAGNRDANTAERCVTAPSATCADFATIIQPIFNQECIQCHSGANAPRGLHLDSFEGVRTGGATGSTVVACQSSQSLLFQKISMTIPPVGVRMPADGPPYLTDAQQAAIKQWIDEGARSVCAGANPCLDATPPTFAGLTGASLVDPVSASLCWSAASDDVTPAGALVYDVWDATAPGGQNFTAPPVVSSSPGQTCITRNGLTPQQQYCFVVRARDGAGNRDTNTQERCVTTPAATCIDFASVIQPIFNGECIHCHSGATAPQGLHLDSYVGVISGGVTGSTVVACQSPSSLIYQKVSMSAPPVGVRMPADGPPYLTDAQQAAIRQWIEEGARPDCAGMDPCSDAVPPVFAGITTAAMTSGTAAELCWVAGTDDLTPAASLVYDVYEGTVPGGQLFSSPPRLTTAAGQLCATRSGLTPGQQYCFVVRARDAAGNPDANTVERCVTAPTAACVDFETMVQPIFNTECIHCHSGANAPRGLRLDSFQGVGTGGATGSTVVACKPSLSLLYEKVSLANPPVGIRMPADGPPYLTDAQIGTLRQWIEEGARASCSGPNPCSDVLPPVFAGITSAAMVDASNASLCWASATDDTTSPANILYDVYEGTAPGGQSFSTPPRITSQPGATCVTRAGMTPGQEYCFVVKARDAAGNQDANVAERCVTAPAAACVDYDTMVQPIFNAECIHCHSGANAPRSLQLTSFGGVTAGGLTGNTVVACQTSASLLFQKISMATPPVGSRMPLDGPPFLTDPQIATIGQWINEGARSSCAGPNPCNDHTPPSFAGLTGATVQGDTAASLAWSAASDNTTSQASILYEVYVATAAGAENYAAPPRVTSAPGAASLLVSGLTPGQQYCFVVRARDGAGNRDQNTVEQCVTMPAASCADFSTMIQPIFNQSCIQCHSGANPPRNLRLDSYTNVIAGGLSGSTIGPCQPNQSLLYQKVSMPNPPVGVRMPQNGPPYLTQAQQDAIRQWITEGARSSCADANPCTDMVPPTFAGLTTAALAGGGGATLSWSAASDSATAQVDLLYDVYDSPTPGGQNFTAPPRATSTNGATSMSVGGLTPGQQYCYVVRARDAAGNRDTNTVERCITAPAAACIDFATMVQPLFNNRCIVCHSGPTPPRDLRLDSYAGVMAGGLTGSTVMACQSASSLLYQKVSMANPPVGVRMPASGPPYLTTAEIDSLRQWIDEGARTSCLQPNPCTDTVPPTFAGLVTATLSGTSGAALSWVAASDNTSPVTGILYDVYQATAPGTEDYAAPPRLTSGPGATSLNVLGLTPGQQYCFVVRARDTAGNRDANTTERCVTVPAAACVDFSTMVQPIFEQNCIRCHSGATPPRNLRLDSYSGVRTGGDTGNTVVACQQGQSLLYQKVSMATPPVGRRMPADGPPYLTAAQIGTIGQWITEGARQTCAAPDPCSDAAPPTFAGLSSALLVGETGASLSWSAGADNVTPPAGLVYDVFEATAPGGQNFTGPPSVTTSAGAVSVSLAGLTPGQQYCWVVRARDGAGNRDTNTVERCVTVPAATCIDFSTVVQPIFTQNCIRCHSGATPPRNLRLDSYAGVMTGGLTGSTVVACQQTQSLLYKKISMATPPVGIRMPADGPPYLTNAQIGAIGQWIAEGARQGCGSPDPCSDNMAPVFSGVTSATATNAATASVCWPAATDNVTPPANMVYDVYTAAAPGGQAFTAAPWTTSAAGATCAPVGALAPGGTYCFVVRARDAAGNQDSNTTERCLTMPTLPAGCVDYDTMVQPLLERNCTRCHSGTSPPMWLRLDSYDNVMAGSARRNTIIGCDTAGSLLLNKVGATPSVGKRMPFDGPPYLAATQIGMLTQWVTNGATRSCSEAASCTDTTAPAFAGVSSVVAVDSTTLRVCWNAASDVGTPTSAIRYDVFESATSGVEVYNQPAQESVVGATCKDIRVGPGQNMCFVVRAQDRRGNRSTNTQELCQVTPAAACAVEYQTAVQPILASRCTYCHSGPNAPRFLDLSSLGGVLSGGSLRDEVKGCNWAASRLNLKTAAASCGQRMPLGGPWLTPAERSVLQAWVASGARKSCSDPATCGDTQAPVFAGASSAADVDGDTVEVCWSPAFDNTTPADLIVYDVFESSSRGGETFNRPASYSISGGASCIRIPTPASTESCYVVRARDVVGNRDTNTAERCATTANVCIAYGQRVQPIFNSRCIQCHSGNNPPKGVRWDSYNNAINTGSVRACSPSSGKLMQMVDSCGMPYDTTSAMCNVTACLTPSQRGLLRQWINTGADAACPSSGCP